MNGLGELLGMGLAQPTGFDELGRPLYRLPTGQVVGEAMPSRPNALATMLRTELDGEGRAIHYQDELQPTRTGNALASLAQGVMQGFTAPGRAARGEPVTLGDVWSTALDWGAISAPMPAPRGAIRAGGMRTQGPADEIAAMLREGRASEITDSMMARLTPEDNVSLYRLYEEGATGAPMPMDEASRMARAREMGFPIGNPAGANRRGVSRSSEPSSGSSSFRSAPGGDNTVYHATSSDINSFDDAYLGAMTRQNATDYDEGSFSRNLAELGHWTSDRPLASDLYSDIDMPLTARGRMTSAQSLESLNRRVSTDSGRAGLRSRFDGVRVADEEMGGVSTVVFDPRNIRSRFARFDPRLSHLAHLSAAGAGAAVLSGENEIAAYLRSIGAME